MINNATTVLSVVVEDKNYDLNFTLQDGEGTVINLTDVTLTFEAQLVSDFDVKFSGAMSVSSAVLGTCKYSPAVTDFPVAGVYNCQVVLVRSGTGVQVTFDNIQITAVSRVPQ